MKKYLKLCIVSVLVSLALIAMRLPSSAEDDLTLDHSRWLHTGETIQLKSFFFEGEQISGACSKDCYDLDLTLYDQLTQMPVVQELTNTATPTITAPYEGDFILEVSMSNCARSQGCRAWVQSEYEF